MLVQRSSIEILSKEAPKSRKIIRQSRCKILLGHKAKGLRRQIFGLTREGALWRPFRQFLDWWSLRCRTRSRQCGRQGCRFPKRHCLSKSLHNEFELWNLFTAIFIIWKRQITYVTLVHLKSLEWVQRAAFFDRAKNVDIVLICQLKHAFVESESNFDQLS